MATKTTEPLTPIRELEEQIWSTAPTKENLTLPKGDNLEGLKYLKPGFTISPAYDRAFALGFPFCYGARPEALTNDEATAIARGYAYNSWRIPREVLRKLGRLAAVDGVKISVATSQYELTPAGESVIASDAPFTPAELDGLFVQLFTSREYRGEIVDLVLKLEPDAGADDLARALSRPIQCASDEVILGRANYRDLVARSLGYLLLRCSIEVAADIRGSLGKWLKEKESLLPTSASGPRVKEERASVWRAVDLLLGGREHAERSGKRINGDLDYTSTVHVQDAPDLVVATYRNNPAQILTPHAARFAFLGGEEMLEAMMPFLKKLKVVERPKYMETFGLIKSPLIVEWLKKNQKPPIAKQLLELHGV